MLENNTHSDKTEIYMGETVLPVSQHQHIQDV